MRISLLWMVMMAAASVAQAELKPEEIGIIGMAGGVNSPKLAEHYAQVRGVPKSQILLLNGRPVEELSREDWETRYRPAIREWLTATRLEKNIRCLVTTMDVPLKIGRRSPTAAVLVAREQFLARAREECVTQMGELIKAMDAIPPQEPSPHSVPDRGAKLPAISAAFEAALKGAESRVQANGSDEDKKQAALALEHAFVAVGGVKQLVMSLGPASEAGKLGPEARQRVERFKGEFLGLQQGLAALGNLTDTVARDGQIVALLRKTGGLLGTIAWIDAEREALQKNETYASFDSELSLLYWNDYPLPRWRPNMLHYSLAAAVPIYPPTLMVSRLAAPTLDRAMALVDTAMQVEQEGLQGKVYLDARGIEYRPKTDEHGSFGEYDQSLRDLADRLRSHTQLEVMLDNRAELFAPGACPDAALYCGWYSLGRYVDSFRWRPGAVGYHLASMEAETLTRPGSSVWCNAMLERGVCATLGPVYEPYLLSFPPPDDFFPLLLTGRWTLVETYYHCCPFTSWVMVLVGDPLYNPFHKSPPLAESDLPERMQLRAGRPAGR